MAVTSSFVCSFLCFSFFSFLFSFFFFFVFVYDLGLFTILVSSVPLYPGFGITFLDSFLFFDLLGNGVSYSHMVLGWIRVGVRTARELHSYLQKCHLLNKSMELETRDYLQS